VVPADVYAALLRRERELDRIQRSLGWRLLARYGPYKQRFVEPARRRLSALVHRLRRTPNADAAAYRDWARFADRLRTPDVGGEERADLERDLVSIVMAVAPHERTAAERAITALTAQRHDRWELGIAFFGAGPEAEPQARGEARISIDRERYAGQAAALNALIAATRGDIVGLLAPTVALAVDALAVVAAAFRETGADVLYCDEDHCDDAGRRHTPRLLPGWSPDLLLSTKYWSRVVFYRRRVLVRLLPLHDELDGAHEYDLALRCTESPVRIVHVPRVLAHVGAATSAISASGCDPERLALELAVERRGLAATVESAGTGAFRVRRAITAPAQVSIIIPTRDGFHTLRRCLAAIERTRHADFEILLVDNDSRDPATLELLATTRHRVLRAPGPFNFARLNNRAVLEARGRYVLFLNDDTEPLDPLWLSALEEHAQRPEVGAVGARLLYPDGRIQHAGIVTGIHGIAGHPGRFTRAQPNLVRNVSAVTAACLMMRREVYAAVGGFDEALPVNSNDVDLCLRLRERGYLVVYTPHAVVRHYESQTRGRRAVAEDVWLMTRRWRGVLTADPYYNPNLTLADETGGVDVDKPDGWIRLYAGSTPADSRVELAAGSEVGQGFFAPGPDLAAVVVRATLVGEAPERALRLVVRESAEASRPLRVVERSLPGRCREERWFCFAPIRESADRFWYFSITAVDGPGATLERHSVASDVMGPCRENGVPAFGTLQFGLYGRAPYRCAVS
jgi:GT2 family glycosyltransferase